MPNDRNNGGTQDTCKKDCQFIINILCFNGSLHHSELKTSHNIDLSCSPFYFSIKSICWSIKMPLKYLKYDE